MDINKQPGIFVESIILTKCKYERIPFIEKEFENNIKFNLSVSISEDKKSSQVFLNCDFSLTKVNNLEEKFATMEIEYVGVFKIDDKAENMDIERFSYSHAPGFLLPYIRQKIHQLNMEGSLPYQIIPPINIISLLQHQNEMHSVKYSQ